MKTLKTIERILKHMPTIAVVGFSTKAHKAGFYVPQYLQKHGYRIVPVNPFIEDGLGETAYASLSDIPFEVDVVEVFRRPEYVRPIIDEAIAIGAKAIWLQRDITNADGRALADSAEVIYIENRCMMVEHRHLMQYGWSGQPEQ